MNDAAKIHKLIDLIKKYSLKTIFLHPRIFTIAQIQKTLDTCPIIRGGCGTQQVDSPRLGFGSKPLPQLELQMVSAPTGSHNAYLIIGRYIVSNVHIFQHSREIVRVFPRGDIKNRKTSQLLPYPCSQAVMGWLENPAPHLQAITSQCVGSFKRLQSLAFHIKDSIEMFNPTSTEFKNSVHGITLLLISIPNKPMINIDQKHIHIIPPGHVVGNSPHSLLR